MAIVLIFHEGLELIELVVLAFEGGLIYFLHRSFIVLDIALLRVIVGWRLHF
jgi:hypothetical protein